MSVWYIEELCTQYYIISIKKNWYVKLKILQNNTAYFFVSAY